MKRRKYKLALAALAVACLLLFFLRGGLSEAKPFPLTSLLRSLSLSGDAGNAAATALYLIISLAPLALYYAARRRLGAADEDALLILLTPALLIGLYLMINPALLAPWFHSADMGRLALCALFLALPVSWAALRLLRSFRNADAHALRGCAGLMLMLLGALFLVSALHSLLWGAAAELAALRAANSAGRLILSEGVIILRGIADALPSALCLIAVLLALDVLDSLDNGAKLTAASVEAAGRLAKFCARALTASVIISLGMVLLQLALAPLLRSVNFSINIPIIQAATVLAALLAARVIAAYKRLADDNELFI